MSAMEDVYMSEELLMKVGYQWEDFSADGDNCRLKFSEVEQYELSNKCKNKLILHRTTKLSGGSL